MIPEIYANDGVASTHETLSTITSSTGFTSSKIAPTTGLYAGRKARMALISVEVDDMRFLLDGDDPTVTGGADPGTLLVSGGSYKIVGENNIENFRCINAVASNGTIVRGQFFF